MRHPAARHHQSSPARAALAAAAALTLVLSGCGAQATRADSSAPQEPEVNPYVVDWEKPGMRLRVLNPGAKNLDTIVTHDCFNHLFPNTVWFRDGDVLGMYNRNTHMTFLVVSEHTFDAWTDELSAVVERLCHEKAHRADDLYDGDAWSELRDTSSPGLQLDTHHYGHVDQDTSPHTGAYITVDKPAGQPAPPRLRPRPQGDPAQLPTLP